VFCAFCEKYRRCLFPLTDDTEVHRILANLDTSRELPYICIMEHHEQYMRRCFQLALKGKGFVAPNPLVGSVIVRDSKIIGEGYHLFYGKAHAEVNAVHSVNDESLLRDATLYVNLEPCAHHGKTPPCTDLILAHKIPRVVIGCVDSFSEVAGKGIEKLRAAGVDVTVGVL
jgi:diaminohydroxyphosphoribosylaminopyrimidine deaminase / 5-amino-6-(5-phosphoribosylamino)uracil reductase